MKKILSLKANITKSGVLKVIIGILFIGCLTIFTTEITYGSNLTFNAVRLPPTCITHPATNINSNSAKLNGMVNPNGSITTAYFQWGMTASYGNTTTSQSIGNGTNHVPVNTDISGLSASTRYNFRIVGINANGTRYGNNLTFTTRGLPPTCTTNPATNVTHYSAKLNGSVNSNGIATLAYFNYGKTMSYGINAGYQFIFGTTPVNVSAAINGLSFNTLYNFRLVGTNSAGTTYGNNLTFTTTGIPPTCITTPATNITYNSAKLNGMVNPRDSITTTYFQWGTTASYGNATSSQSIGSGTSYVAVTANINGLSASTRYNFRVIGTNTNGTTYGNNLPFITAGLPPTCTTNPATNITHNSAKLNGSVNPNGPFAIVYFNYGKTMLYGINAGYQFIFGRTPVNVSAAIAGLSLNTLYNFRVVGINANGITYGNNLTFTTHGIPPTCTTYAADNITYNSARLNGRVNPKGSITTAYFQWGTTASYGNTTASQSIDSGTSYVPVQGDISGLSGTTLYNFRVVAINSGGTTNGNNLTFTTAVPPPNAPTNLIATTMSNNCIHLQWTDNSDNEQGFIIERINELETETTWEWTDYMQVAVVGPNIISYSDCNLISGAYYGYRVKAYNVNGHSEYSNESFVATLPVAPINLTATTVSYKQIDLKWVNVCNNYNVGVGIERSTDGINYEGIGGCTAGLSEFSDTTLQPNTTYYYRVTAVNRAGLSQDFATTSVTTLPLTIAYAISNVNNLYQANLITDAALYTFLIVNLNDAQNFYNIGDMGTAIAILEMVQNHIWPALGQGIDQQSGEGLYDYVGDLIYSTMSAAGETPQTTHKKAIDNAAKDANNKIDQNESLTDSQKATLKQKIEEISRTGKALINIYTPMSPHLNSVMDTIGEWTINRMSQAVSRTDTCPEGYSCDVEISSIDGQKHVPDPITGTIELSKKDWKYTGSIGFKAKGPAGSSIAGTFNVQHSHPPPATFRFYDPEPPHRIRTGLVDKDKSNSGISDLVLTDFSLGEVCNLIYIKFEITDAETKKPICGKKIMIHLAE
ncbi:MAG: hypothetical protein V1871_01705 [Planctomycetota bacterium]